MRTFAAATLVAVLMGAPLAAGIASDSRYTPGDPSAATLAGSALVTECRSGDPWIDYRVQVTDPSGSIVGGNAVLVLELGSRTTTVPLGALADGTVSGSVPWPADAAVDAASDPSVTAILRVEPSVAAPLSMPLAVTDCDAVASAASLPLTGLAAWVPALGVVGAALVAAGVSLGLLRRRRAG
jgi:LPXTG-motif cell wall-anchored protein